MVDKGSKFETFALRIQEAINNLDEISRSSIEALVCSLEAIEKSLRKLDKILSEQGEKDDDCKLLTTVPGVGIIVAMAYKAAIDNPHRFEKSDTVGEYIGLTPRQYSSGEVDRHGSISKMGPAECRSIALFTIIRTDRNMLLACYSHKHISYRIRTIIRKAICYMKLHKQCLQLPRGHLN